MTGDIQAIACTHIGGYPCDLDGFRELAQSEGIPLVEDCAHAIGAEYRGNRIGDGTLCCFSFGFPKAITGVEGGAVLTDKYEYAEKIRALRNLGMKDNVKFTEASVVPVIEEPGYRYIWNDVMASIALKQMDHFEADNRRRAAIAKRYEAALGDVPGVFLPRYEGDRTSSYFFIPLFFERRDDLSKKLDALGIRSKIYFRGYSEYCGNGMCFPNAAWYGGHELTLPINLHMSDEDQERVISAVREGW
jgi:UDP-4-amino-4-deoxy-L-arabinose-oxoglutarate aminotransferase